MKTMIFSLFHCFTVSTFSLFCIIRRTFKHPLPMKLYVINTGNLKLDGGAMFGVVPKTLWQKAYLR